MSKKMTLEEYYQWKTDGSYEGQSFWDATPNKVEFEKEYVKTKKQLDEQIIAIGNMVIAMSEICEVAPEEVWAMAARYTVGRYIDRLGVREDKREEVIEELLEGMAENGVSFTGINEFMLEFGKALDAA